MIIDERLVQQVITPRPAESHKGTYGRTVLKSRPPSCPFTRSNVCRLA